MTVTTSPSAGGNAVDQGGNAQIPANVELVRRHPEYLRTRAYRPGLAYALRLSAWRRIKHGDVVGVARDIGNLSRAFGGREAAKLAWEALRPRPGLPAA